jgi:hypothetical protein
MWTLAFGHHEDRTPTHGLQVWRHVEEAVCRASELNKSTKTPAVRKRPDSELFCRIVPLDWRQWLSLKSLFNSK